MPTIININLLLEACEYTSHQVILIIRGGSIYRKYRWYIASLHLD